MAESCTVKWEWPQLVGKKGSVAKTTIENDSNHWINVQYIHCDAPRPPNVNCLHVWLDVKVGPDGSFDNGTVCRVPKVG